MKKITKIFLAITLLLLNVLPMTNVNAATNTNDGEITINNTISGKTYAIYQILKLESYDTNKDAYTYIIEEKIGESINPWWTFLNSEGIKDVYVKITPTTINGETLQIVTWVDGTDAVAFSEKALTYAKNNNVSPVKSITASTTQVTFNELNLGYYLIDSSLGALCGLTTTNPKASINEKNSEVLIEKLTGENGNFGSVSTAEIGDIVDYKATIYANYGAEKYVFNDVMSEGITLNKDSIKITLIERNDDDSIKSSKELVLDTDYSVLYDQQIDVFGCTAEICDKVTADFRVDFSETLEKTLTDKHEIVVEYNGTINENAEIFDGANPNDSWLDYGDDNESNKSTTTTYTYKFDLVKTDNKDLLLDGAEFKLYDAKENGNQILVVYDSTKNVYRIATDKEIDAKIASADTTIVVEGGFTTIVGLDNNKAYWLEEVEAPDGFNKLTSRIEVSITNDNLTANLENSEETDDITYIDGGVRVVNTPGAKLPETGGMGTTLFITIGSIMVIGFGVLLVTKFRLEKECQ